MLVHSERAIELAADALARLDLTCTISSPSAALALEIAVAADLLGATPEERLQLVAAQSQGSTSAWPVTGLLTAWSGLQELQRRARSGGRLSLATTRELLEWENQADLHHDDSAANDSDEAEDVDAIDAILQAQASPRAALSEAAELAARAPGSLGQLLAALHLVSRGRTDRLRFLPPALSQATEGTQSTERLEPERFLIQLADAARALTGRMRRLPDHHEKIDKQLDTLGRAAITARAVLAELRISLALTVPELADALELSRPAIHDACDRLITLQLIRECTARERGRVYAESSMLAFALPAAQQ